MRPSPPSIYGAIISKMCVTPRNWNWVWACPWDCDTSKCYLSVVSRGVPSDLRRKKGRNPLEIKRDRNEINMYALLDGYIYALQTGLIFGLTSHNKYFTIGKLF